jgi:hypothetical protein
VLAEKSPEVHILFVVSLNQIHGSGVPQKGSLTEKAVQEKKDVVRKSPDGEVRKAWLFQSNPDLYDLRGALRSLREQIWSVRRFAKEIRLGDRVYVWESGRRGGIVGLAEVSESPRLQSEPREQVPFIKNPEIFAGDRLRVKLRILRVIEPAIARQRVLSRQDLASLGVLRCARGTNFRLSEGEARGLEDLFQQSVAG